MWPKAIAVVLLRLIHFPSAWKDIRLNSMQIKVAILLAGWLAAALKTTYAAPPVANDTTIHQLADRRVIIEHAPGIILPEPPEPFEKPAVDPATPEQLAEAAANWRAHRLSHPMIHAGATVYRMLDGRNITHVTNFRVNNGPMVSFWSSADFSLLAHRVSFNLAKQEDEVNYTMLLFWSQHDVARWAEIAARRGRPDPLPEFPTFPEGAPTWIMDESDAFEKADPDTTRAIEDIHKHYEENQETLRAELAILTAEREARRAALEANPPQPRDIHLRVSRLDPKQAAKWHKYAVASSTGRYEADQKDGGAE
jgi:hypothetical protein